MNADGKVQTRRTVLFHGISGFLIGSMAGTPVLASKDKSRPDRDSLPTKFSQDAFLRLSERQIHQLFNRLHYKSTDTDIDGFSGPMSTHIIDMLFFGYRRGRRLMKQMQKTKDLKKRKQILQREIRWAEAYEKKLHQSVERLKGKKGLGTRAAFWQEKRRLEGKRPVMAL